MIFNPVKFTWLKMDFKAVFAYERAANLTAKYGMI